MTSLFLGHHEYDDSCHIYIKKEGEQQINAPNLFQHNITN